MCAVWVATAPWKPVHRQLWHRVGCVTWCPPSRRSRSIPFPPPAGDLLCSRGSRPCGDGLSVRSTCGFLPPGEGRPHARRDLLVGDSHLFRLWPHDIKKKKGAAEAREWGAKSWKCLGQGPARGPPGVRGHGAPRPGSTPETQEHLALGLRVSSVSRFPGPGGCRLGVPACAHTSVTSGPRAWGRGFRLSDGIRIAAHFALGHLSDRRAEL